jgi:hypothetical protein
MEDEVQNTARNTLFVTALLATAISSGARADTVSGRITYLDLGAHKLMLDSSDSYDVAVDPGSPGLEIGRLVTVEVAQRGSVKTITKIDKYT